MRLTLTVNVVEAQDQDLTVSDTQNSGCLSRALKYDGEERPIQTIILEKEGNILSVQLLNFVSNCATSDFEVSSKIDEGSDGSPCTMLINAVPVGNEAADCICQFNVSFTIHDVEPNTFYLDCWWYKGLVELTEGDGGQLGTNGAVFAYKTELAVVIVGKQIGHIAHLSQRHIGISSIHDAPTRLSVEHRG